MSLSASAVTWLDAWLGYAPATNDNRLVITGDFTLYNKSTAATLNLYACIGRPGYTTGAGDTPASVNFLPRLEFPDFSQTLAKAGEPSRRAPSVVGVVALIDADGYYRGATPSSSVDYLDRAVYEWRSCELRIGTPDLAYTSFEIIQTVRFEGPPQYDGAYILLRPAPALLDTKAPAYDARWPGFDTAYQTDGTSVITAGNSDWCIAVDEDAYWRLRFKSPANASTECLWSSRDAVTDAATAGWSVYLNSSGALVFRIADGATEFVVSDTGPHDDGAWHDVQVWIDRSDDTLNGLVDGVAFSTDADDVSSLLAVTSTDSAVAFEETDGQNPCVDGTELDELYFATGVGIAPTADQRKQHREGPASPRGKGCKYYYGLDEGGGVLATNFWDSRREVVIEQPGNRALEGTAATREVDYGDNHDIDASSDFTIWCWFRTTVDHTGVLVGKKGGNNVAFKGWRIATVSGGAFEGRISDGTTQVSISATPTRAWVDGACRPGALVIDRSGVRGTADTLYLLLGDSSGQDWEEVGTADISAVTLDPSQTTACRQGEDGAGANNFDGDLSAWAFVSGTALTDAQLARYVPIHPTPADIPGLAAYYAFDAVDEATGIPATIADQVGSADGTSGAGATWVNRNGTITAGSTGAYVATLTGSYTTINGLHGGGGRSKQQGYGYIEQAPLVWIDNRGNDHSAVDAILVDAIVGSFHVSPDACEPISSTVDVVATEGGVTATAGQDYVVDLTNGYIYWDVSGGFPVGPIRIEFKGAKFNSGAYSDRLGLILREILTTNGHLTAGQMPAASANDLDALMPYPVGVLIPGGLERPKSIGAVLNDGLSPHMYWATDLEGEKFILGISLIDPSDYTAAVTLTDKEIELDSITFGPVKKPARKVSIGHARQWGALSDSDVLGSVSADARSRVGAEWSYAVAESGTIATEDGREVVFNSPLINYGDAQRLAQDLLPLMGATAPLELSITRYHWQVALADEGQPRPDVLSVTSAHFAEISAATSFMLTGVRFVPPTPTSPPRVELQLWREAA